MQTRPLSPLAYPVMEQFYSIQGEGFYQGEAAYFIRLAGCDVGCVWCDVKDSWDAAQHPLKSLEDIKNDVIKTPSPIVVITGGEPLLHNCDTLTTVLKQEGVRMHLETSGAYTLSGVWDWICVSPKKFKAPLDSVLAKADELKVIVYHKSDFLWAEEHAAKVSANCMLYLQPEWSKTREMTPLIFDYVKNHPKWKLSLQIHKYIGVD